MLEDNWRKTANQLHRVLKGVEPLRKILEMRLKIVILVESMTLVAECLPNKHKILSSNPSTDKKRISIIQREQYSIGKCW
jgi:hypothetical protein